MVRIYHLTVVLDGDYKYGSEEEPASNNSSSSSSSSNSSQSKTSESASSQQQSNTSSNGNANSSSVGNTQNSSGQGLIKGNINSKGEKIYHLPGDPYYDRTKAEKWFNTEAEAQAAGYRPSKR
ncbi:hypothetical protein ACJDU8_17880 [Clostridium sp. WILCCON 0269]|uniref:Ada DNA repair metal-binding domain-containing protein n=1 Tax=Candidatus Clostridium eludens TaxID=3381663 RepID=A0ABW8SP21_9CLOT